MTFLAQAAAQEFTRRRALMQRAVRAGQADAAKAEQSARLWLAIAAAAGCTRAELPELTETRIILHPEPARGVADREDVTLRSEDIAPRKQWLPELARARDVAARKALADPANRPNVLRSFALASLAIHLGASPPAAKSMPQPQRGQMDKAA